MTSLTIFHPVRSNAELPLFTMVTTSPLKSILEITTSPEVTGGGVTGVIVEGLLSMVIVLPSLVATIVPASSVRYTFAPAAASLLGVPKFFI